MPNQSKLAGVNPPSMPTKATVRTPLLSQKGGRRGSALCWVCSMAMLNE